MFTVLLNGCINMYEKKPFLQPCREDFPFSALLYGVAFFSFAFSVSGLGLFFSNHADAGRLLIGASVAIESTTLVTSCARKIFCSEPHRIVPYRAPNLQIQVPGAH